ncbi:MAG: hypothetical protein WB297_00525 [Actinomycetota bacterium]
MRPRSIRRAAILMTAAVVALGLGASGIAVAFGGRPVERAAHRIAPVPSAASTVDPALGRPWPWHASVPSAVTLTPTPSPQPAPDPNRLADGVYPTYIRAVDRRNATITVDVLQTFFGTDARRAAIEDGVVWKDVRYDPVYIRNENPLLRTLPVARAAHIKLIGVCEAPNRWIGLTELRDATTPFTDTFYYDITVVSGTVERVDQLVAVAGC